MDSSPYMLAHLYPTLQSQSVAFGVTEEAGRITRVATLVGPQLPLRFSGLCVGSPGGLAQGQAPCGLSLSEDRWVLTALLLTPSH